LHVFPVPQSAFVEHWTFAPASSAGGVHWLLLQTVPCGHSLSAVHLSTQPCVVQKDPLAHSLSLVQGFVCGGATLEQP
jgi:hypothetical protein